MKHHALKHPVAEQPGANGVGYAPDSELFRHLVESVADYAIFMLDPRGCVTTWNVGAQRIKGYSASEIMGKHFSTFYPEDDVRAGKCARELEEATRDGRFEDEGWRMRKDGTQFWANVVITAVRDHDGNLLGFAKITRDLTERKRAEEAETARLAAEHANRTKDEFLAILSHELRNPLAPIVTALQLMEMRGRDNIEEVQVIERQVKHMLRLVDDLLDIARITHGSVALQKQRLDIRDVVARSVELSSPLLEQRGHHLDLSLPAQPVMVFADEARLAQVFTNLLTNAAKYSPAGGHVALSISEEDGSVVTRVADEGDGISQELLPKVFDLFVQGPRGADRALGGLGIGLALVRMLVEMHGGTVTAKSPGNGRGSTFTVTLPITSAAEPLSQRRVKRDPSRSTKPRRVLVVDDNDDAAELLVKVLSTVGHEVKSARDAAEALEAIKTFSPEIGVLDIGLPVMDGYTLASRMREQLGAATPKLIALTGYGQQNDRERSAAAGFQGHFVKPVEVKSLLEAIETIDR